MPPVHRLQLSPRPYPPTLFEVILIPWLKQLHKYLEKFHEMLVLSRNPLINPRPIKTLPAQRLLFLIGTASMFLIFGCTSLPTLETMTLGPSYRPKNVHRQSTNLPDSLRRIAVLPLSGPGNDATIDAGRESLEPLLRLELQKYQAFELVFVTQVDLKRWTAQGNWTSVETLPREFFDQLRASFACDGVLFCHLTQYHPYKPLAVGWRLQLVDAREPRTWWSVDEVFDSAIIAVANGARRYYLEHFKDGAFTTDSRFILSTPERFAQYTLDALFATLPTR